VKVKQEKSRSDRALIIIVVVLTIAGVVLSILTTPIALAFLGPFMIGLGMVAVIRRLRAKNEIPAPPREERVPDESVELLTSR